MEYVILDLEWDSVYYKEQKRFINQILQIGAVRLNSEFEIINSFEATIHSDISKKVSTRFAQLTGITSEKMLSGVPLADAVRAFNSFSKGAEVTMTWSDSDLYAIVENEKLLENTGTGFILNLYLDLQKLVQYKMKLLGYESNNQVSLEAAAQFFGIDISNYDMHTALADSTVCAKLFKLCYDSQVLSSLIKDAKVPSFYEKLRFKPYPITEINDKELDLKYFAFNCSECGERLKRKSNWKYKNRWFAARMECPACRRRFLGRVFAKRTYEGLVYKRRLTEIRKKGNSDELPALPKTM
ncbi:MAG: exonuclease domain-containing protein [Acutalibacteraceae bacterium]|jgi:DNA polymerase III epsilon subunit-like protein